MHEYKVTGESVFTWTFFVKANSPEEAEKKGKEASSRSNNQYSHTTVESVEEWTWD